jgi:hypothetical protein
MITDSQFKSLLQRCQGLPPARGFYLENDFVKNLFLTVLDFQMHSRAIAKAMHHYESQRWSEIRTLVALQSLLAHFPDDKANNIAVAQYLWGNNHWTRVSLLRRLIAYFVSVGVTSQEMLVQWAKTSDFHRNVEGKIPGVGLAIYKWLVMRQGVETVKPDVHLRRFVRSVVGDDNFTDSELVSVLERVANRLGLKAYELDWRIWEYQRGGPGA